MRGAPEPHVPLPSCSKRHAVAGQGGVRRRSPCAWGRMSDVDAIPGGVTPFLWINPARIASSRYQMWRGTLVRAQTSGQTGVAAPEPARLRRCECPFASKQYLAHSIDGPCTVRGHGSGRECEFGFSGVGANRFAGQADGRGNRGFKKVQPGYFRGISRQAGTSDNQVESQEPVRDRAVKRV